MNAGSAPTVAGTAGGERAGNRGDGGKERERSRWGRDRDQATNNAEISRDVSNYEDQIPSHQPDRYVHKFYILVIYASFGRILGCLGM